MIKGIPPIIHKIKATRSLFKLLGKLRIRGCYEYVDQNAYIYDGHGNLITTNTVTNIEVGIGLRDAKMYCDRLGPHN